MRRRHSPLYGVVVGFAADEDEVVAGLLLDELAGAAVDVVVAVLVVAVLVVEAAGVVVDAVVAVEVDDEWPAIIFSSLWQPPTVIINAAAQTTTETRMDSSRDLAGRSAG